MESSSTRASSGKTLKLSYDKHFTSKLKDVITLFMNHPEKALVLGVDEKSQIQALDLESHRMKSIRGIRRSFQFAFGWNHLFLIFSASKKIKEIMLALDDAGFAR